MKDLELLDVIKDNNGVLEQADITKEYLIESTLRFRLPLDNYGRARIIIEDSGKEFLNEASKQYEEMGSEEEDFRNPSGVKDKIREDIRELEVSPTFPDNPDDDVWYQGYNQAIEDIVSEIIGEEPLWYRSKLR